MNKKSQTNSDGFTRMRMRQAVAMKNPHLPMTEPWRGKCRLPLNKSTCWAPHGAPRVIPGYFAGFGHPTCPYLPCELPGTSLLRRFPWVSLLHGSCSWKRQHPFKDKQHDDEWTVDRVQCRQRTVCDVLWPVCGWLILVSGHRTGQCCGSPVAAAMWTFHTFSIQHMDEHTIKLDSIRWFSTGTGRRLWATNASSYRQPHPPKTRPPALYLRCAKCSICYISGIWIQKMHCTYLPRFIVLYIIVSKLSCLQMCKRTKRFGRKHPPCSATLRRWREYCNSLVPLM